MSRFNYTFEDIKTLFRNECCKECKKKYSQRCINCEQIKRKSKGLSDKETERPCCCD